MPLVNIQAFPLYFLIILIGGEVVFAYFVVA